MIPEHLRQVACVVTCMSCTSTTIQAPVLVNANMLVLVTERQKEWTQPRTTLELSAGSASDCESYVRLRGSRVAEEVSNQLVKGEYLICDVLEQLGNYSNIEALPVDAYGAALASRLDLRSFPSSLGPMVDDQRYTLSRLFDGQVTIEPDSAVVRTPDVSFSLKMVLVGDVDHSGHPDWLVWLADEVPTGNYHGYETLLIKDAPPQGMMQAHSL